MRELLKKINKADINNVNLYLFSKPRNKEKFEVFSTIIDKDNVKIDMKSIIENQIRNYVSNENYEIYEYNPIFEDKTIVQKINCNELEYLPKFIDKLDLDCPVYDENDLKPGHELWLYSIVIDDGKEQIISFQKIRSRTLLKNEKYWISFGNKKIKRFEEPLLQLEQKMDCICILEKNTEITDQVMYIFDKHQFESIFGFEKKFKKEIQEMLNNLETKEYDTNLLNLTKLYQKVENNKNHLKKLYVILKNDSFRYLNEENIKKIEDKSRIKFNRATEKLELNTNDDVKKILNFLNDDFLEGIISEKPFVTSNKRDI